LEFFSFSHGLSLQVKTTAQLDAALSFLATTGSENLDLNKFEEACGVGNK
jgi:glutaminyl-tRNA synthetase